MLTGAGMGPTGNLAHPALGVADRLTSGLQDALSEQVINAALQRHRSKAEVADTACSLQSVFHCHCLYIYSLIIN